MINPISHLYFRAKVQPDAVAIQRLDGALTYRQLLTSVRAIAYKLRLWGVQLGQIGITFVPNRDTHWVITLALMHEALVSCSNHGYARIPANLDVDVAICDRPIEGITTEKTILIDNAWLRQLPTPPDDFEPASYPSSDSLSRLVLTSGTTGTSKVVCVRVESGILRCQTSTTLWEKYAAEVNTLDLSTAMGALCAMRKLLGGGTLYYAQTLANVIKLINAFHVEYLCCSPIQLARLTEIVKPLSVRPSSLKMISYVGGQASPAVLEQARANLCSNVVCVYGSTEAGLTATFASHHDNRRSGEAGYILPEVDVEIVDEEDAPVQTNRVGRVRVRGPYMETAYYRDADESARYFRDGWFYPGDRGSLDAEGMLALAGREREIINRGGVKVDPVLVDQKLQEYEGVRDAAAFGYEDKSGIEAVGAAIVVDDHFDIPALRRFLLWQLGQDACPQRVIAVSGIPRNEMGKPLRVRLQELYGSDLREQGAQDRPG